MTLPATISPVFSDRPERSGRLLIVDRSVLLAEAIANAAMRAGYEDAQVVTGAGIAHRLMSERQPTIVLIDLQLAVANDFELIQGIHRDFPQTGVVLIVDDSYSQALAVEALVVGAAGLVYRSQGIASLLRVLDVVHSGDTAVPRQLTGLLLSRLRQRPPQQSAKVQLSARQREVLKLVARGLSDKAISEELHISLTTVRSHLRAIFEKTNTGNRTAAALWASDYFSEGAG